MRNNPENIIPDLYFKDTFLNQFVAGVMGVGNTRTSYNHNWFNFLYLTDSDKPENINEQRVMGNVIGYAHRNTTYAGTDPIRGTINRAETRFEVTDNKIKLNFVFDFPTHSANGTIESIYWAESDPDNKDYFYSGACVYGRETSDTAYSIDSTSNPSRYWAVRLLFNNARKIMFTSPTKGWVLLDGKLTSVTQTTHIVFPDELKGHWLMMPFDINTNDIVLWDQVVRLLNYEGDPLVLDSAHNIKKYDTVTSVCPYTQPDGTQVFIGYYTYSISSETHIRIFRWSRVGVQLSYVDLNIPQTFKDVDYNIAFTYRQTTDDGVYVDGCIDIIGYVLRNDSQFNENTHTSRWIRIDSLGNKVQDMDIKPKIGNSQWFGKMGMNSGNIERRSRISTFTRSANRIYLYYIGLQGGTNFYQVINTQGNVLEPYRMYFGLSSTSSQTTYHILGTNKWISRFYGSSNEQLLIRNLLSSRPIGAHTKLAQPIEKTDANTMKIQYMFEIDLVSYGEDHF